MPDKYDTRTMVQRYVESLDDPDNTESQWAQNSSGAARRVFGAETGNSKGGIPVNDATMRAGVLQNPDQPSVEALGTMKASDVAKTAVVRMPDGTYVKMPDKPTSEQLDKLQAIKAKAPTVGDWARRGNQVLGFVKGAAEKVGGDIADMARGGLAFAQEVGERAGGLEPDRPVIGPMVKGAAEVAGKVIDRPISYPLEKGAEALRAVGGAASKAVQDPTGESAGRFAAGTGEALLPFSGTGRKLADVARGIKPAERTARDIAKMQPDVVQRHSKAAKLAGLPQSDPPPGMGPKGGDLESITREQSRRTLNNLAESRRTQSAGKWDAYRNRGAKLEADGQHFTITKPGAELMQQLRQIESGGYGMETSYTDAERKAAKDLRLALSGLDKEEEATHPVSLDVVDKELRHLRALQFDRAQEGYSRVVHDRFKDLGDKVESALRAWVGPEYYPREHYAAISKEFNKWDSKLARALTGEQDIEYLGKDALPDEFQGKVTRKLFSSQSTVEEGVSLLGRGAMEQLSKQYISNSLRSKTSEAALKWVTDNQWIAEFPETNQKTLDYLRQLAVQEGKATTLKGLANLAKRVAKPTAKTLGVAGAGAGIGYGGATISGYKPN